MNDETFIGAVGASTLIASCKIIEFMERGAERTNGSVTKERHLLLPSQRFGVAMGFDAFYANDAESALDMEL